MGNARHCNAKLHERVALVAGLFVAWFIPAVQAVDSDAPAAKPIAAEVARLAPQSLLIDIAAAGERWVAVGERGHIVLSNDRGLSWSQATRVPVQALLTAVCFFDSQHGLAVGHDETILSTSDGGETWSLAHYAPGKQQPLLDVWCGARGHAIAVGAYSSFYELREAGAAWSSRSPPLVPVKPAAAKSNDYEDDIPPEYHFNRIVAASPTRLYIAAEAGHLYRSDDAGASWIELSSPYAGSFFGALPLSSDEVLVFGLRGHLYRSSDAGVTWQKIETHTDAMLNYGVRFAENGVAIVGLSGVVLTSHDGGRSFDLAEQPDRRGISAALAVGNDALAIVGEGGARTLSRSRPGSNPVARGGQR